MKVCDCDNASGATQSFFVFDKLDISVVFVSILTIWIVHRLTRNREREKYVFDLCKTIETTALALSDLAYAAWSSGAGADRLKTIAQTRSQIQLLGALINRLEILTDGWRMRWTFDGPGAVNAKIALGRNLIQLRQAITEDPFADPARDGDADKAIAVTSDVSIFLLALDLQLRSWIKPF